MRRPRNTCLLKRLVFGTAVAIAFWATAVPVSAHKYYASLAHVNWNEKGRSAEVAIKVFADDLEAALTAERGRRVRLDVTPDVERLVEAYITANFLVANESGDPVALAWVGMEPDADAVWIYLEAAAPNTLSGWRIHDKVLFDRFSEQVNTVNVSQLGRKITLTFKPGSDAQVVHL